MSPHESCGDMTSIHAPALPSDAVWLNVERPADA
jgi:hypothetical protein